MPVNLTGIKHLIFDLGGVIIDLDTAATFRAFEALTGKTYEHWRKGLDEASLFLDLERGTIGEQEFRDGIRKLTGVTATDEAIDRAWNAMLGDIPLHRLEKLLRLKQQYRTFVLSNTNSIHERAFNEILRKVSGKPTLDHFFDRVYFSHNMCCRKPETEIYRMLLDENGLEATETLFLDDKPENLRGAEKLKIQTFHVPSPDSWLDLFAE